MFFNLDILLSEIENTITYSHPIKKNEKEIHVLFQQLSEKLPLFFTLVSKLVYFSCEIKSTLIKIKCFPILI